MNEMFASMRRPNLFSPLFWYWRSRLKQHTNDSYLGIGLFKFPEDLRTYEHIIWNSRPNVIIEIGTLQGGSALWFRDRLAVLAKYGFISKNFKVISIDKDISSALSNFESLGAHFSENIHLIEGDVLDSKTATKVSHLIKPEDSCMVIEDSAHTYAVTLASLKTFSEFVSVNNYLICEDGVVDEPLLRMRGWPKGVRTAIRDFLQSENGASFEVDASMETYGLTSHPGGFLRRVR